MCGSIDISFTSIHLEGCKITPNCCKNYHYLNFYSGILNEVALLLLYTALFWMIALGKRQRIFWQIYRIPRDNVVSQLVDYQRRHDNDETRFSEYGPFIESVKVVRLSGREFNETPLICQHIGKTYGGNAGIERFSLILKRGEAVAVVGENGCGKSTLSRVITTLENLSYGRIWIMGINSISDRNAVIKRIGQSQQYNLKLPEFTIESILNYLCYLHDYPKQHIPSICVNLAKILGIYSQYKKSLSIISQGTFKSLLCAIALLGNRPLLVMDKISISIDQVARNMLWRVLLRLKAEGTAILFITNSFEVAEKYCDRICVMSYGRCHYLGSTSNFDLLYKNYRILKVKFYHKIHEAKYHLSHKYIYVSCLNKLQQFMASEFPTSIFKYELGNFLIFLMPMEHNKVWRVFRTLQQNAYFLNIEYFELSDTLLVSFEEFVQQRAPITR